MPSAVQLTDFASPQNNLPRQIEPAATLALEDNAENWRADPLDAFLLWQSATSKGTREVRWHMWKCFYLWLRAKGIQLEDCTEDHVGQFFDKKKPPVIKAQRYRYILLIESVWRRLAQLGLRAAANPGSKAAKQGFGDGSNATTQFLTESERLSLETYVRGSLAVGALLLKRPPGAPITDNEWVPVRNAVIVALMVGAGLKVSEVRAMSVSCTRRTAQEHDAIRTDRRIEVPPVGRMVYRHARMLGIARAAWPIWFDLRLRLGHGDGPLFRAEIGQRLNGHRPKTLGMHATTIFRLTRDLMKNAGIEETREAGMASRICPGLLRNTYGAQLVDCAQPLDDLTLQKEMGFHTIGSATRLRLAYTDWREKRARE